MNDSYPYRKPKRFIKKPSRRLPSKGLLLFFIPFSAIPATILAFAGQTDLIGIAVNAGGYALFVYAAWLLRHGLAAEARYNQKTVTGPPKWPLKTYAALVVASATGLVAWMGAGHSLWAAATFACGAFLGMYLTYGFDPRTKKIVAGKHGYSADEIVQTIDEAESTIARIEQASERIDNQEFGTRIQRICDIAQSIVKVVEQDPADIRRARKFLNVYLEGAQRVTEGYANTHRHTDSQELEQNFRNVLETIETVFQQQKDTLVENNVFDLDVQIEVLETQLKHEGVL